MSAKHSRRVFSRRIPIPALVVTGAAASLLLAACGTSSGGGSASGGSTASSAKSNSDVTLGFLSWDAGIDPFNTAMVNATLAEGKKLGVAVDYVDGNNDLSAQISGIQDFITKKVNAIIVDPANPTALVPILNEAAAAGIPVINLNEKLASDAKVTTYVGDDDTQYGVLEGDALVQALGSKGGTFALAEGQIGVTATTDRTNGIESVIKSHPTIKMVAEQSDNWQSNQMLALTQDWANKYPNLSAIVVEGPEGSTGGQWAQKNGHSSVKFIVGDYPTYVATAIKAGQVYAAIDQSPVEEAQDSVIAATDLATGKSSQVKEPAWFVGLPTVTNANVNTIKPAW